jgi:putative MATE family efflux protein
MPTPTARPPAAPPEPPPVSAVPPTSYLARRVLFLAWPVLALNSLVLLVDLSDRFLIGNLPGAAATDARAMLSAQATAHYVAWFISSYTVLVSVGATAVVAHCVGAGDWRTARRATHQALVVAAVVGVAGSVVALLILPRMVIWMGLSGTSADYAVRYLRPMFQLLAFRVIEVAGIACLIGAGDTRTGLFVQGGVAVTNVVLAWTLCRGFGSLPGLEFLRSLPGLEFLRSLPGLKSLGAWPGLGFAGVPLGTAISYALAAVAVVIVLARGRAGLKLKWASFRPDLALIYRLLRVSVPAALDSFSLVAGQFWFLHIVNGLGVTAASAHGIAIGWEALGYLSGHAFGTAAITLVGQALGARQPALAAKSGWTAFALGCGLMTVMGAIFFALAPGMFWVFCQDPEQQPVIDVGVPVLRLVAFAMPALASTIIFTAALRGAGDTRVPVLFTWVGFLIVRIPLAYLLTSEAVGFGLFGAWLAMAADLIVRGVFFWVRFASGKWQRARV